MISLACVSSETRNLQRVFRRIKDTQGAVVYVGSSLTVHNPLLFVHKL